MSMSKGNTYNPQDFINLKTRVKNEMLRRNGYGSLASYGGVAYDFTNVPKNDDIPKQEHYTKIRDLMANINPSKVSYGSKLVNEVIPNMDVLEANLTTFEAQSRGARSTNDCSGSCTGMCVTACTTGCSGCSGCGGACSSNCSGCDGCSGCGGACSSNCTGCSGCSGCGGACSSSCSGACSISCSGTCYSGCSADCAGCTGCSGTCCGVGDLD